MGITQINGKRIASKSIRTEHLSDDFVIPEKQLSLDNPTHKHENFEVLKILINSNPALLKKLDLLDVFLAITEVTEARDKGQTLKNTLERKASKEVADSIIEEITNAKGKFGTLAEALRIIVSNCEDIVNKHTGIKSHAELDELYAEIENARGSYSTLKEKMNTLGSSSGSGGTGNVDINMLTPWNFIITLEEHQTEIDLPNSYTVGNNSLQVFEGPTMLYHGNNNDYTEISSTKIKLNYELPKGTKLRFIGVNSGRLFEWVMYLISTDKQDTITFIDNYRPNELELLIYEDGLLLQTIVDFDEIDERHVKLKTPFVSGSNIAIFKRRY